MEIEKKSSDKEENNKTPIETVDLKPKGKECCLDIRVDQFMNNV